MKKFVVGNWKMNGTTTGVQEYAQGLIQILPAASCEIGIAVPSLYLPQLSARLGATSVAVVAQDVSQFKGPGAYTGEISAQMLKDAGCTHVLIGHSERRHVFAEDDLVLVGKIACAVDAGLVPIICIGEELHIRQQGRYLEELARQLAVIERTRDLLPATVWVAYEPVWAIGTGLVASTAQISEAHAFLADKLRELLPKSKTARLLYGGSVKGSNAAEILALPGVDGVLVGSASLTVSELGAIIAGTKVALPA
ncbi:MAG: triose-phosphate isomerase [Formivibrio sp.]|nr:triose-phosphate isomerase [Formivibrio sp.]